MLRYIVVSLLLFITLTLSAQYNIPKLMQDGKLLLDKGNYVTALQIFQRITSLKPNIYKAWYSMALAKYHLEDYKGSLNDCTKALELQPYIAEIYELYGMLSIKDKSFDNAIKAYTKAIKINPKNRDYWFNRAYSFYMINKFTEALNDINYIFKHWKSFKEAQYLRSDIIAKQKQKPLLKN